MINQPIHSPVPAQAQRTKFQWYFLLPKFWPVWLGFTFLALLVNLMPYRLLKYLGFAIGRLIPILLPRRRRIIERNLSLAFPEQSTAEQQRLIRDNFANTGLALFETAMAWFWPKWRFAYHIKHADLNEFQQASSSERGGLLLCAHMLNLEMTARLFSLKTPGYGVYRPHKNPVYEWIQYWGRTRNGNQLIDRRDLKGMLKRLKQGYLVWFLADHDYGEHGTVFAPFFAVAEASTITTPQWLIQQSDCHVFCMSSPRKGDQYQLYSSRNLKDLLNACASKSDFAHAMNQQIEQMILIAPEQWMWLHRRYKTHPNPKLNNMHYL